MGNFVDWYEFKEHFSIYFYEGVVIPHLIFSLFFSKGDVF